MAAKVVLVLAAMAVVGCSSAPKSADEVFDERNRAAEYARFGNDYYRSGDYERAMRFFTLALASNGAVDNRGGIAETYNSLGKTLLAQGRNQEAVRHFDQALRIGDELADEVIRGKSFNNLGEAAFSRGEFQAAAELFSRSLDIDALQEPDRAVVLHNLGACARRLGDVDRAEDLIRQALEINDKGRYWAESASNRYVLASLYSERGLYERALVEARSALENDRKVENGAGIAKDYIALGKISLRTGDNQGALGYFERGVFVYQSLKVARPALDVHASLTLAAELAIEAAEAVGDREAEVRYRALLAGMVSGGRP